jgi:hypothetical protein
VQTIEDQDGKRGQSRTPAGRELGGSSG